MIHHTQHHRKSTQKTSQLHNRLYIAIFDIYFSLCHEEFPLTDFDILLRTLLDIDLVTAVCKTSLSCGILVGVVNIAIYHFDTFTCPDD